MDFRRRPTDRTPPRPALAVAIALMVGSCGGGSGPAPAQAPSPGAASDAEWRALATPRPEPLDGAPRVALGSVEVLANDPWDATGTLDPGLGLSELAAAGLLRRRDVRLVERRRFAAAVDAERSGRPRPQGAPAAGVSPGAKYLVEVRWSSVGLPTAFVDVRLTDAATGQIVQTWRGSTPPDADPASVARTVVAGALATLRDAGALPAWTDPRPESAPEAFRPSGVPLQAQAAFFRGLGAEERWDWEGARQGYQAALSTGGPGFFEAEAALARAARLRNGGTLGAG